MYREIKIILSPGVGAFSLCACGCASAFVGVYVCLKLLNTRVHMGINGLLDQDGEKGLGSRGSVRFQRDVMGLQ